LKRDEEGLAGVANRSKIPMAFLALALMPSRRSPVWFVPKTGKTVETFVVTMDWKPWIPAWIPGAWKPWCPEDLLDRIW